MSRTGRFSLRAKLARSLPKKRIGGGVGYYFKIYRPKHQRAESENDFDYSEESGSDKAEDLEQPDELPESENEDGNSENGGGGEV